MADNHAPDPAPTEGQTETGRWRLTPGLTGYIGYPQRDAHPWGAFAGFAVELGGYRDIELVDPYTGSRFWYQPTNPSDEVIDWVIEALQAAKQAGWGKQAS